MIASVRSERSTGDGRAPGRDPETAASQVRMPADAGDAPALWSHVLDVLRQDPLRQELCHWASQASAEGIASGRLFLHARSKFVRDQLTGGAARHILTVARSRLPSLRAIRISWPSKAPAAATPKPAENAFRALPRSWPTAFFSNRNARPRMRFERFVAGPANASASQAAMRFADAEEGFPSLVVHGPEGCGKTHLRHATVQRWAERNPGRTALNVSSDEFWHEYAFACKASLAQDFRHHCARVDLLVLDEFQNLAGRGGTQKQLIWMLGHLLERGGRVLALSDRPLSNLQGIDDKLIARLRGGPDVTLAAPPFETKLAILQGLARTQDASSKGVQWHENALTYVADNAADCRDLEGCFQQVLHSLEPLGLEVTRERAREILQSRFLVMNRRYSVAEIRRCVAQQYGVDEAALRGRSRVAGVKHARQVAMYLCREMTGESLAAIGAEFARDHSTVSYSYSRIRDRCSKCLVLESEVREAMRKLRTS